MEDLRERPRKLIHEELRSQYLENVTYKDINNISRNMHKARCSQLLPLPTDTEETHEALSVVQVPQNLLVNGLEKNYCNVFMQKQLTVLSSIDGLYVDGTFKSAPTFFHQLFTIHGLTMCHLHISYRPINIQRPIRIIRHTVSEAAKLGVDVFPTIVYADFETAIHNKVTTVWPGLVKACRFHLGQS